MERFRVTLGKETHLIGAPEPGVLMLTLTAVVRKNPDAEHPEHECYLSLGGMDSTTYTSLDALRFELEAGARIGIEILPDGPFDGAEEPEPMPVPPWAAEDRAKKERAKDEHDPIREAAEDLGWTLIEAPTAAELASSYPSSPPEPPPLALAMDTSSTRGMERFRVGLRGRSHLLGVPGPGVLSVMLHAVVRDQPGLEPEERHECILELGGLYGDEISTTWAKYDLTPGDHIEIEILAEGPFDEPATQTTQEQRAAEYEQHKREWVRSSAKKLGWAVIEGLTPALPS